MAFSFGHDHIGDGLRPSLPNYVHIGMLNCQCQPKTAVPVNMVQFMESDEAKKFGVIIVAFGTLIGPPQVSCNQSNDFFWHDMNIISISGQKSTHFYIFGNVRKIETEGAMEMGDRS